MYVLLMTFLSSSSCIYLTVSVVVYSTGDIECVELLVYFYRPQKN